ncbi:MAG TPA: hypothetical protein VFR93_00490 [Candidatus Limnocylindrales bacterium]|nr:hypothetical protein [Candidatus Limnocylindrales bacterium]
MVAWDRERRALLHVENRTQLPNVQEAAGAYNAKRTWLAASVAERIGIPRFRSVTHAFVGLWSSELLHVVRLRRATIAALCPDPIDSFEAWLAGHPPDVGVTSSFALLDPIRRGRTDRRWLIDLATALGANTRSRYRDYTDAADALRRAGMA